MKYRYENHTGWSTKTLEPYNMYKILNRLVTKIRYSERNKIFKFNYKPIDIFMQKKCWPMVNRYRETFSVYLFHTLKEKIPNPLYEVPGSIRNGGAFCLSHPIFLQSINKIRHLETPDKEKLQFYPESKFVSCDNKYNRSVITPIMQNSDVIYLCKRWEAGRGNRWMETPF